MRIKRQTEIAIEILIACARHPDKNILTGNVAIVAEATKDHAAQVVSDPARAGFLSTKRGRKGGVRLAVSAKDIRIGDVIRSIQPYEKNEQKETPQVLTFDNLMDAADENYLTFMDGFTIADFVGNPNSNPSVDIEESVHSDDVRAGNCAYTRTFRTTRPTAPSLPICRQNPSSDNGISL